MKRIIITLFIGITFFSCNQKEKKNSTSSDENQIVLKSLTAELDSIQKSGDIIGFSVAIVDQNGVLYENGFGLSNIETKEKYTENTIQHIASVSKTLIGVSLMKATEMGKLKLDDPIQNYLPFKVINPNHPTEPITIRHLATHTSGINDTEQYMEKAWIITNNQNLENVSTDYHAQILNPWKNNIPMEEYLKAYLEKGGDNYQKDNYLNFKPGERFNYSNIGATLTALIIEKATGKSFDKFTNEFILNPLNMTSTGWSLSDIDISKHARLYRNDNSLLPFYTAVTYPDGMLISSSNDMAKYLTELIKGFTGKGTILKKESYEELYKEQLNDNNFEEGERNAEHPYDGDYNPAIFIGHSALGFIGHSGGDAGVSTWMYFNKKTLKGMYIVVNTDLGDRKKELEYYAIWGKLVEYSDKFNE
jgi:CubicO group peptidase (beta-lactamase class C family)